jgi:hypothetical protein
MKEVILFRNSMCSSFQMPRSQGDILPFAVTAIASVNTSAAPPIARVPKCTRCQSFAQPSSEEYWHIGDVTILFLNSMPFIRSGSNNFAMLQIRDMRGICYSFTSFTSILSLLFTISSSI